MLDGGVLKNASSAILLNENSLSLTGKDAQPIYWLVCLSSTAVNSTFSLNSKERCMLLFFKESCSSASFSITVPGACMVAVAMLQIYNNKPQSIGIRASGLNIYKVITLLQEWQW